MWEPGPFPKAVLKHVQGLEGNSACMDCGRPETSWGGPTYGILLCVKCAGRHRSLGSHLSVIKSLTMDRWDAVQMKKMELGGNEQLRAWFTKCQTENNALEIKYRTKVATLYRASLQAAAEEEIARHKARGEEGARSAGGGRPARKGRIFAASEAAAKAEEAATAANEALAKSKKKDKAGRRRRAAAEGGNGAVDRLPSSGSGLVSAVASVAAEAAVEGEGARRCGNEEYEVVFGAGGMGFTLMKDAVSRALVTRLAPGGAAFRLGVRTGDYLVGVDGHRLYDYDQLMVLLPRAPRPLRLLFEGAGAALAAPPTGDSASPVPFSQSPSSPLVSSLPSSQQQRGNGADRGASGSSSDSDSDSVRSSDSSSSSTSGDSSSSNRSSTSETDAAGGETPSAASPAVAPTPPASAAAASGGRMSNGKATPKEDQPRPPPHGVVPKGSPAAADRESTSASPVSVPAAPVPSAGARKTVVPPDSIKTPRVEGKSDDLAKAVTNGDCSSVADGRKRVTVSDGRRRSESNGRTDGKEEKKEDDELRREGAKGVVAMPGEGNEKPRVGAMATGRVEREARVEEVVSLEAYRKGIAQAEGATEASALAVSAVSSGDSKGKGAAKAGKRNGIAQDRNGHGSRGGKGDVRSAPKEEERAATSSSRRSLAAKDCPSKDDSSVFTQGAKVLVRDRKGGSKMRKGLLRRKHGDGSWTVRYSGGMEERHVPPERMRPRASEEPAVAPSAGTAPDTRKAPPEGKGHRRRHQQQGGSRRKGGEEKGDSGRRGRGSVEVNGGGGQSRSSHGAGKKGAWTAADGTEDRHEDFRVPGELRDDFFSSGDDNDNDNDYPDPDSDGDDAKDAVPGLIAYGRMEPPAAAAAAAASTPAWNQNAYSTVKPAFDCSAPYPTRIRMEGFGGGEMSMPSLSAQQQQQQQQEQPRMGRAVSFPEGSMGLTLTKEMSGGCSVTNVVMGGTAHAKGVVVGQRVCAVNGQPTGTYEQTMAVIAGSPRPVSITFLDPINPMGYAGGSAMPGVGGGPPVQQQSWANVGIAATIGAMDAANAVAVEWGLGVPTTGVLDEVHGAGPGAIPLPPQGFRVHQKQSLMAIPTGVAGGFGKNLAAHRTYAFDVPPELATMTTKKALADKPESRTGEFDVTFGEGELGMRLEERGSFKASSVVVRVSKDGQAVAQGVREGCTVVGINGEEYLSHAHTVATLKHAKRPVTVRFCALDGKR